VDRLWSPWRLEYVTGGGRKADCIFCTVVRPPESDSLVVFEGSVCYVILNLYPYNNGHLMVVPYRHVATLTELTSDEMNEVGQLTQRCEAALDEVYRPQGFNVGINIGAAAGAGVRDHVHVHVVPRWNGDTNFMPVVGNTRVLPEELGASAARLRPVFARLTSEARGDSLDPGL
jgi:ATP adenylyltransferase